MAKRKKHKSIWPRRIAWLIGFPMAFCFYIVMIFAIFDPSFGFYAGSEARRLGGLRHQWVDIETISPKFTTAVVAAEDANFCNHSGFEFSAIWDAYKAGSKRGGSSISQQVAKNVYLWHGRSYIRKGLEAGLTAYIELFWTKRRILEVYMNVAEFDEGIFGAHEAAHYHFGVGPDQVSMRQAALLAAVLPNPKGRSAIRPSAKIKRRAKAVQAGAETIQADGRAECFM